MNYCTFCGVKLDLGDSFCSSCGADVSGTSSAQPQIGVEESDILGNQQQPIETFYFNSSWKTHLWMGMGYPAIALIGGAWLAASPGSRFADEAPFLIIGLALWLFYAIYSASKGSQFSVEMSADTIRVGNASRSWDEIRSAERVAAAGTSAAIVLTTIDNQRLEIPAVIDSIIYIWAVISKRVPESKDKTA